MEDVNNTRRRPRSTSPFAMGSSFDDGPALNNDNDLAKQTAEEEDTPAERDDLASRLRDPLRRNQALNELLKLSLNHELNYALESDAVLKQLVNIAHEVLDWTPPHIKFSTKQRQVDLPSFTANEAWSQPITNEAREWANHCKLKLSLKTLDLEKIKSLEVILGVLRNLSYVAANHRLIAFSPDVLDVLVGSMYECMSSENLSTGDDTLGGGVSSSGNTIRTLALPALNTLVNISPYLDVTGQKLFCDKIFLSLKTGSENVVVPSPSSFGQATDGSWGFGGLWLAKRLDTKEDVVQDVSKEMLLQHTHEYLVRVWSIFPALATILTDPRCPRLVLMAALDLLQEFVNQASVGVVGAVTEDDRDVPNARSIVAHVPTSVLDRLSEVLYVPRLGPDSLDYVDPTQNLVTRVTTLKLLMGYDATVDTDVRDRALDILVPLLELDSPALARRLGGKTEGRRTRTSLYDAIFPILTTQVGRNEAPLLASQLLKGLAKAEENRIGLLYLQERVISLASRDPRVAHLAFNFLYPVEDKIDSSVASDES